MNIKFKTKLKIVKFFVRFVSFDLSEKQVRDIFLSAKKGMFIEINDVKKRLFIEVLIDNNIPRVHDLRSVILKIEEIFNLFNY